MEFFKKKETDDSLTAKKNWYADRYQTVVVQRNFLLLLTLISLAGIITSVLAVIQVTSSKTIEPFVIEIEEKTGITTVIRPLLTDKMDSQTALQNYFIVKYINARENYDSGSYNYNYSTVVRLLSSSDVYSRFRQFISSDSPDSPLKLGANGIREVKVISITPLETATDKRNPGQKIYTYQVRFLSTETIQGGGKRQNFIATINFSYLDLKLSPEERNINPLGFQVIGYRTDEENLQ
jgi:type IV secretion system protein VirB8